MGSPAPIAKWASYSRVYAARPRDRDQLLQRDDLAAGAVADGVASPTMIQALLSPSSPANA